MGKATIDPFPDFSDRPTIKEVVVVKPKKRKSRPIRCITKAKTLTKDQFERIVKGLQSEDHAIRNEIIWRLSFFCGLRVQEIAGIQWKRNVLDQVGKISRHVHITKDISKWGGERMINLADPILRDLLKKLRQQRPDDVFVVYPLYGDKKKGINANALSQYMRRAYKEFGYDGCTSHSGRRTYITGLARNCNLKGTSIADVQRLAGHRSVNTTIGYVEDSPHRDKLVQAVFENE